MKYRDNISSIKELIASGDGVFTTAQADCMDIPRRALSYAAKTGAIERVTHGAYRDATRIDDGFDELRAIWMLTAPEKFSYDRIGAKWDGVCAYGTTAAAILGIGDFHASPYQIAAGSRINSRKQNVKFHKVNVEASEIRYLNGIPVTSPERTIADMVQENEDMSLVADAFIDAIKKYGATSFDMRKLENSISKDDLKKLYTASGIGVYYGLVTLDSVGHVALAKKEQDE